MHNDLINTVLLARDRDQVSPELVQRAIREAVRRARRADLARSIPLAGLKRWGLAAGGAAAVLAIFALLQPGAFGRGLMGVDPTTYLPAVNRIELIELTPGDRTIFAGQPVTLRARIRNDEARRLRAEVEIRDGAQVRRRMVPSDGHSTFTCTLPRVDQSFHYVVRIGGSRWPADREHYTITVIQQVRVEGLDLRYEYPAYTGREWRTVRDASGQIEAPQGTRVEATVRLSRAVPRAVLELRDKGLTPLRAVDGGRRFVGGLTVEEDAQYRIVLSDAKGRTVQQLPDVSAGEAAPQAARAAALTGYYAIRAIPDRRPSVGFVRPNRDVSIPVGGRLQARIKASDDYGLSSVVLLAGREGDALAPVEQFELRGRKAAALDHTFELSRAYADGDVIVYYATATDNRRIGRLGPQTAESSRFKILVQDANEVAAAKAKRYERLRRRLLAILALQETQKVNAAICAQRHPKLLAARQAGGEVAAKLADLRQTGGEVLGGQRQIKAALVDLAENFPFDDEMVTIHQAVAVLGTNEAQTAIDQAQVVVEVLRAFEEQPEAFELLDGTQEKIIETLRMLLAVMPSLADRMPDAAKAAAGEDLPPEAQQKIAQLKHDIEKFIDEEKKVIEASKRLAKTPVDDFTQADEELLKELQAVQDKWEKFLNERFTDFSKLLTQDFSNPTVMKELISVKSDVTMAKDALKKKAAEIATAIEDNGIENAESLTANIEKWLPDEPDRTKWRMEDPTDGMGGAVEQPELPNELEDLVGDLLEEEEDLFEEADDQAGKYAMSGDKGIGWDAMDGPISNMNAQGVTGNQLPNTNELQGRSGEGRQGKSSGEFVEDKAVGKGGRRTPTRLTPEPFQKGEVKDESKEPPGGATGGGKLSGAGEEGLEGPVPRELQKALPRMAGKQAALINRAERLREFLRQDDYANFKLLHAITLMNRVRSDLVNYRYRNALRARDKAVKLLRETKLHIGRGIDVTTDATAGMPKYQRDDIAEAREGKMPEGFEEVMEEYYGRLAEHAGP
jgi:hypothetical protein